jgi:hypothetical protein
VFKERSGHPGNRDGPFSAAHCFREVRETAIGSRVRILEVDNFSELTGGHSNVTAIFKENQIAGMFKNFLKRLGWMNALMLLVVFSIIVVAETRYLQGHIQEAIFIGLWAPTILGLMNYLKINK